MALAPSTLLKQRPWVTFGKGCDPSYSPEFFSIRSSMRAMMCIAAPMSRQAKYRRVSFTTIGARRCIYCRSQTLKPFLDTLPPIRFDGARGQAQRGSRNADLMWDKGAGANKFRFGGQRDAIYRPLRC